MELFKSLPELNHRRQTVSFIHTIATEHDRWLDYLSAKYNKPRAELIAILTPNGSLEREIAILISDSARAKASDMLREREWPDSSSPDLFDRAVYGHWRQLRDAEIKKSAGTVAELKDILKKD